MENIQPMVHVVDDDAAMRESLERLLHASGYQVRAYSSAGEFLIAWPDREPPGCIVLDMQLPGPSGLDLYESLSRRGRAPEVVFLTGHGDIPTSVRAMREGAVDFLTKPVTAEALLAAVRRAFHNDSEQRARRARESTLTSRYENLSAREREVFWGVVDGDLNKQIAARLGTSERTVKAQRASVLDKLQAGSVAALVNIARELEKLSPQIRGKR